MKPSELTAWRKKQGLTQKGLAEKLGVAEVTIFRWEKAMRAIPPFLHLTLECMEKKGDELRKREMKKRKEVKK
ncbi:MAG: helix-turn-helix transcriptional regulator [Thermodesulfovibrionales bacterium]